MFRFISSGILALLLSGWYCSAQTATPGYAYHPPSEDKLSWQRLNLWLSSTYIVVVKEGQVDHDTCLYLASRSLGLSRLPVLAEGIADGDLPRQTAWIDAQQPGTGVALLSSIKGRKRLPLLALLGAYYAFQPGSHTRYKDSVEYFVHQAITENEVFKDKKLGAQALCLLGKVYVQANDPKGDSIFNLVINQARRDRDKETEARAIAYRGIYTAPTQASFQQKLTDLQTAAGLYQALGNTEREINVLMDLGYMQVVTGQFQPAQEGFLKALALAEQIRYPYTHYITDALTMVTVYQGKFGEPFRYTLQSIEVAENVRDSIGWVYFYSRLAFLYDAEGRMKESMDMAHKAIDRFVASRNPSVYNILNLVIDQLCNEGRAAEALDLVQRVSEAVGPAITFSDQLVYHFSLAGCYLSLNRLDDAEVQINIMDSLETEAERIRGPLSRSIVTDMYGHLYFKRGQYQKAREFFEKQFTTPSFGQRTLVNDLNTYRSLLAADSALGDQASGLFHYKKYTELLDSNFRVTKIRQAEELQVTYETQEKESQIAILNQQAKQTQLVKNLTLGGIGAAIIIAFLLYRQSQNRKKNNAVITFKNEQLQQLVNEKEWLLREVHHRVKNNLQIIMSLLNSQSVYINNDAALTAIHDSQRRVHAISLIHQKLYQSDNVSSIVMPLYIQELAGYLEDGFDTDGRVTFALDIEPVELDVSQAIPLGLIINEGIVNTLKYAFPDGRKGVVSIQLKRETDNTLLLKISDNGVGLPAGLDVSAHNSLGFNLMKGLARQLNGDLRVDAADGLIITVRFIAGDLQFSDKEISAHA
ncbi:sensor histidine kinase [Flavihumibacter petaseus]|uniref:histidine kinase n=1 Tax=Flavihumibacter petaseus NBRC 106054 TaxID=1220578 RepID=A0A0E9N4F7_9BACT|nr:sensor histidine kinase [Flavihumibacter petaseus]GAO44673.1 putative two-component histidine kinase [Flavihumibacter petaseus NBRC 106054]